MGCVCTCGAYICCRLFGSVFQQPVLIVCIGVRGGTLDIGPTPHPHHHKCVRAHLALACWPRHVVQLRASIGALQVQFDHQVLLHLAAYAATMAGVFGTCGAMGSASKMHLQCTVVGSVLYAWLNFVVGVIVPLTACSVIERGARLAFLTAPKAHAHKAA